MTGIIETIGIVSVFSGILWFSLDKHSSGPGWMLGIAAVTLGVAVVAEFAR